MIENLKRMICWLRTRHIYIIHDKFGLKICGGCGELRDG